MGRTYLSSEEVEMGDGALDRYRKMAKIRAFELVLKELWDEGRISGELHLGTGEEAVVVGVAEHLVEGDAMALDHRPSPMMLLRGVEAGVLIDEMLGSDRGICRGRGGHMHLFSPRRLAASSGIVGASGPLGAGFALAAKRLRPGTLAVSFFGDGAVNQGQLMEAMNLAVAWSLPQVFVCKNNGWAITTESSSVTGGDIARRAEAFGLEVVSVDGLDVEAVVKETDRVFERARAGHGPAFVLARCSRLDGHMLGDAVIRVANSPVAEGSELLKKTVAAALTRGGGGLGARMRSSAKMMTLLAEVRGEHRDSSHDPLNVARKKLHSETAELKAIDEAVAVWAAEMLAGATTGGAA